MKKPHGEDFFPCYFLNEKHIFFCSTMRWIILSLLVLLFLYPRESHSLLDGTLLSTTYGQSCANVYDNNGGSQLQCDDATVLELELSPDNVGGAIRFLFQNTNQNSAGGGFGNEGCDGTDPGTCIGDNPFFVNIEISKLVLSYSLDLVGLEAPFGYLFSTCLTRSAGYGSEAKDGGAYPDSVLDQCGPTITYNIGDYVQCSDFDAFAIGGDPTMYSECIMQCDIDIQNEDPDGNRDDDYCQSQANDLVEDFRRLDGVAPEREHLACRDVNFASADVGCMPFFPLPSNLCPCGGGADSIEPVSGAPYTVVPMNVCKSGTCAGTCGSAFVVSSVNDSWCDGRPFDECCNVTDPSSVCVNTAQDHRCLKCQPTDKGDLSKHSCYYLDLNDRFRCGWDSTGDHLDLSDWCGDGDFVMGGYNDPGISQDDTVRFRDSRTCNCDANFVEHLIPVSPMYNPYEIRNPPAVQYTMLVYFTDLDNNTIPGSEMVVGIGWSEDNEFPPNKTLPLSQYTPDGFALTRILATDTSTGKVANNLQGLIVMGNNGATASCTPSTGDGGQNNAVNVSALPTPNINTTTPDGRFNPWGPAYFDSTEAKVPLPDQVFRYANANSGSPSPEQAVTDAFGTWWYYVPQRRMNDYGRGCGQIGMFPSGNSVAGTAETTCNGPPGTCIPGLDTLQRGDTVDPPCNVASDWYRYVVNNGGTYATLQDRDSSGAGNGACHIDGGRDVAIVPPHLFVDWDPVLPQYWIHAGNLYREIPPNIGQISIRTSISIAADFQGEVITQAPGVINDSPQSCSLDIDVGTGSLYVSVDNTGTQAAQYTLIANCTQGLEMADVDGVTFSQAPGSGGSTNLQVVPLIMLSDIQLTPSEEQVGEGILVPACIAELYPSALVLQNRDRPMSASGQIGCIIGGAIPELFPNGVPPLSGEGGGIFIPPVAGSSCSIFSVTCHLAFVGDNGSFFTSTEEAMLYFFFAFLILVLALFGLTICFKQVALSSSRVRGATIGMQNQIEQAELDEARGTRRRQKDIQDITDK